MGNENENYNEFLLTKLDDIYKSISVEDKNFNFEDNNLSEKLYIVLENSIIIYNKDLLGMLNFEILRLPTKKQIINELFVVYLKNSFNITKNIIYLFTNFCEYFDFDYQVIFEQLHEKIQYKIKNDYKKIIGVEKYNRLNKKYNNNNIKTLFDL